MTTMLMARGPWSSGGIQVALLGLVVLLVSFRVWEREHGEGSNSIMFGLMAASALAIGVLKRYRANAARRFR
ncbi:hypothetical protein ABZY10_37850 [Streptomyces sp. NPDC006539]|uniref:hypothetical protein n=1 Tax=Streptomyces sp. NPDC006539 TaxID=3155352 RepID=UPI0033BE3673